MESNKITNEMDGSSNYKHLNDYIKALEDYHEPGKLKPEEIAILDEFHMIKRQLEILEILKTKLIDSYYRDETDTGEMEM